MTTLTAILAGSNRTVVRLDPAMRARVGGALVDLGLDPFDCTGASLMGISDKESAHLQQACGHDAAIGGILAASEDDGTRIAIVASELMLLVDDARPVDDDGTVVPALGPAGVNALRALMEDRRIGDHRIGG